jgi:hypothetical protein
MKIEIFATIFFLLSTSAFATECGTDAFIASASNSNGKPNFKKNIDARIADCHEKANNGWVLVTRQTTRARDRWQNLTDKETESWMDPKTGLIWSDILVKRDGSERMNREDVFGYNVDWVEKKGSLGWTFKGVPTPLHTVCDNKPFISDVRAHLPTGPEILKAADDGFDFRAEYGTEYLWSSSPFKAYGEVRAIGSFSTHDMRLHGEGWQFEHELVVTHQVRCVGRIRLASDKDGPIERKGPPEPKSIERKKIDYKKLHCTWFNVDHEPHAVRYFQAPKPGDMNIFKCNKHPDGFSAQVPSEEFFVEYDSLVAVTPGSWRGHRLEIHTGFGQSGPDEHSSPRESCDDVAYCR